MQEGEELAEGSLKLGLLLHRIESRRKSAPPDGGRLMISHDGPHPLSQALSRVPLSGPRTVFSVGAAFEVSY